MPIKLFPLQKAREGPDDQKKTATQASEPPVRSPFRQRASGDLAGGLRQLRPPPVYVLDAKEYQVISKTRRSLLSVCHQFAEEWGPVFYRTTTFRVNRTGPDNIKRNFSLLKASRTRMSEYNCKGVPFWRGHCASIFFDDMFLKKLDWYKLQKIRKIPYDVVWGFCSQNPLHVLADFEGPRRPQSFFISTRMV